MGKQNLLILHGAIGASDQFIPLAEKLAENFDIYLFEFSGHGQTPFSPHGFSIPVFANELAAYIETNFPNGIDVFGYSMGGYVAMYLCKSRPELVKSLCTLGTKWKWSAEIAQREVKMLDAAKIREKIPAFANLLEQRHAVNGWEKVLRKTANMMVEMGGKQPLVIADYRSIKTPTLVMLGEEDEMVSGDETTEVVSSLPNSRFLQLTATKHPIEKVNISLLASELTSFFGRNNG